MRLINLFVILVGFMFLSSCSTKQIIKEHNISKTWQNVEQQKVSPTNNNFTWWVYNFSGWELRD